MSEISQSEIPLTAVQEKRAANCESTRSRLRFHIVPSSSIMHGYLSKPIIKVSLTNHHLELIHQVTVKLRFRQTSKQKYFQFDIILETQTKSGKVVRTESLV